MSPRPPSQVHAQRVRAAAPWWRTGVGAALLALCSSNVGWAQAALPERLSETGLYQNGTTVLRTDVLSFTPQYPLWSDGTSKRRWVWLPPGAAIDARNPNVWEFPIGTRFWKEFALGRRIETRHLLRADDGRWRYGTYVWNEDGTEAVLAPAEGIARLPHPAAPNGMYPIPSQTDCLACHEGAPVPVLGFSALQLSSDRDPLAPHREYPARNAVDLPALIRSGRLRNLPQALLDAAPRIAARTPAERAALGYLHANCGHCHARPEDSAAAVPVAMLLAQRVDDALSSATVLAGLTELASRSASATQGSSSPVQPGDSANSLLLQRMASRHPLRRMPPLGTQIADVQALELIARWIDAMPNPTEPLP